jgi:hypothetical protein
MGSRYSCFSVHIQSHHGLHQIGEGPEEALGISCRGYLYNPGPVEVREYIHPDPDKTGHNEIVLVPWLVMVWGP